MSTGNDQNLHKWKKKIIEEKQIFEIWKLKYDAPDQLAFKSQEIRSEKKETQ